MPYVFWNLSNKRLWFIASKVFRKSTKTVRTDVGDEPNIWAQRLHHPPWWRKAHLRQDGIKVAAQSRNRHLASSSLCRQHRRQRSKNATQDQRQVITVSRCYNRSCRLGYHRDGRGSAFRNPNQHALSRCWTHLNSVYVNAINARPDPTEHNRGSPPNIALNVIV